MFYNAFNCKKYFVEVSRKNEKRKTTGVKERNEIYAMQCLREVCLLKQQKMEFRALAPRINDLISFPISKIPSTFNNMFTL